MQLLHLYYFKLLAENEHLLNTAKAIHISAPALSTTISRLEDELGVSLFDRVGRKIQLNENGRILYIHVCNIFSELDNIKRELSKSTTSQKDIVHVGVSAQSLWTEVIITFMKEHPSVMIKHDSVTLKQLQDPDLLNHYDFIITDIGDITDKSFEHEFIIEDPPALLVNVDHPFAKRDSIALSEARNEPVIALSSTFSSRAFFDNACKQAGFVPHIVAEVEYGLRTQLIEHGYGIGFSSILGARAIHSPLIKMVRVKYPPNPRMQTIFWKTGAALSDSMRQFRDYLINFYQNKAFSKL